MPALKTAYPSDESRVLLIGAPDWFSRRVTEIFSTHEIPVTIVSDSQFLGVEAEKIDAGSMYKILWWVDFDALEIEAQVAQVLQSLPEVPLVIAGQLPEAVVFEREQPSQNFVAAQQFFESLPAAFPEAQLFFARDLVDSEELTVPLDFSLRGLNQQLLLDPESKWFLSSKESFFSVIEPVFIRPHSPRRVIVRGRGRASGVLLKKFADILTRYYHHSIEVSPVLAQRLTPDTAEFVETTATVDVEEMLDSVARQKNRWETQVQMISPPLLGFSRKPITQAAVKKDSNSTGDEESLAPAYDTFSAGQKRKRMNEGKRLINQKKDTVESDEEQDEEKIEGELARIFQQKRGEQTEKRIDEKVKIVKKIAKKSRKNKALFFGGMAALTVGVFVLVLWGVFALSAHFTKQGLQTYFADLIPASAAEYKPGVWSKALTWQTDLYQKTLGEDWLGDAGTVAAFDDQFQRFQAEKKGVETTATQYFLGILGRGEASAEFPPSLAEQMVALSQTQEKLLESAETMSFSVSWREALEKHQRQLTTFSQLPDFFTSILGGKERRVYAVLLQNNLELRPTGGFIQAVGLLVFDKGLLVESQVVNTYDLDSRLPGAPVAPAEIRRYLGEESWFLRDGNWNPDFYQAAQQIHWFVRQATGVNVDGVVAMNYVSFQRMLEAVGPLELPSRGEVLTQENLLERVEFHSDDELSRGENKKAYAQEVFAQFLQHLQDFPAEKTPRLFRAWIESFENRNLFLALSRQEEQEIAKKLAWTGEVITPSCPSQFSQANCLVDQIFQVEANIGLNRVNRHIRRSVTHEVDLSGQKIQHTRALTLENTAPSEGWPLGLYKAYIRFYLDADAAPASLMINGRRVAGDALSLYTEGGRRVVGVPLEVPRGSKTTLELVYTTHTLSDEPFSFLLFDQKQSGVEGTPTTITLHTPDKKPALIAPSAKIFGNTVEFSLLKNDHLFVGVSFQ